MSTCLIVFLISKGYKANGKLKVPVLDLTLPPQMNLASDDLVDIEIGLVDSIFHSDTVTPSKVSW